MNNKILRLLYVDDEIDILLSNYLDETYNGKKIKFKKSSSITAILSLRQT